MTNKTVVPENCNVAIIGSGPAGLATAIALKKLGVDDVIVLERNSEAGGNPRHCGHSPFGMREFKRIYFGPVYAKRLVQEALKWGVEISLNTTVTAFKKGAVLILSTEQGLAHLHANKVVLATGIREKPRSARLITGQRPLGIMTAGALQSMVYLSDKKPFERPVIIGSELVSFSAIATCKHAKIEPVAMIEENSRPTAYSALKLYPIFSGVKYLSNTRLVEIHGKKRVTGVSVITNANKVERIECDGVVFTGQFTPEASLARMNLLAVDTHSNGPVVDQFGRCSDPDYFALGNVLRPVETGGWCWKEGAEIAKYIAASLSDDFINIENQIRLDIVDKHGALKYCVPQRISLPQDSQQEMEAQVFQIRFNKPAKGKIIISNEAGFSWSKAISGLPERRILLKLTQSEMEQIRTGADNLKIDFQEA